MPDLHRPGGQTDAGAAGAAGRRDLEVGSSLSVQQGSPLALSVSEAESFASRLHCELQTVAVLMVNSRTVPLFPLREHQELDVGLKYPDSPGKQGEMTEHLVS